jgi:hypothetical protein
MRRAGNVTTKKWLKNVHNILVSKPEYKRPIRRPKVGGRII